ncbi:DUF3298 and DUF4163 domain-containing protein [Bacillus marasmi]|uniref:DUF3298 and DUF4163 domain-containing protein n=1 Tax=Bacillus marasmi TaxID=1926279 RepID=UPI0011CB0B38|nr:DUF3298 and DUF4163 domain-containing protein [Bacillus marasmi]
MLKMIIAIAATAIIGVGGYFGYQEIVLHKSEETTKPQNQKETSDDLKVDEVQKILESNLDSILNTFNTLGDQHQWGPNLRPDFNIIRPEVLPFATEEFADTSLKEFAENYYCDCDSFIYPQIQYDVRFIVEQEDNKLNISAIEPATEMTNMGFQWEFQLIKENETWKLAKWETQSLQGKDLKLTKEEARKLLSRYSSKPEFIKEYESKDGARKAFLFKIADQNSEMLMAISSKDTQLLYDYQEHVETETKTQATQTEESNSKPKENKENAFTSKITLSKNHYNDKDFITYPQVSGVSSKSSQESINAALTGAAKKAYDAYLNLMKEQEEIQNEDYCKEMPDSCHFAYDLSYEVKYNADGKLSISFYDYTYTGGAHGNGVVSVYNFDIKTGKQYQISDMLKTPDAFSKVTEYAFNYLSTNRPYSSFVTNKADFTINENTQFSYGDDGIFLIFQEYEVASYADGHPAIFVPTSVYK